MVRKPVSDELRLLEKTALRDLEDILYVAEPSEELGENWLAIGLLCMDKGDFMIKRGNNIVISWWCPVTDIGIILNKPVLSPLRFEAKAPGIKLLVAKIEG